LSSHQELNFKSKPNVWAYFSVKASTSPSKLALFFCGTHHHICNVLNITSLVFNTFLLLNMYLGMIETNPNIISVFLFQSGGAIHEFSDSQFGK
jgi:hypothetical protein